MNLNIIIDLLDLFVENLESALTPNEAQEEACFDAQDSLREDLEERAYLEDMNTNYHGCEYSQDPESGEYSYM